MWNIAFTPSTSYFDIQTEPEYRILTFEFLLWHWNLTWYRIWHSKAQFWHTNWGQISNFDIWNLILTFKFGLNIAFWHLKSYFDIRTETKYRILTSKPYFDIWTKAEISNFDIQNPILRFIFGLNMAFWHSKSYFGIELRQNIVFLHSKPILTVEMRPNIEFWHSKSYFDIQIWPEYRILTLKSLFWHSKWGRI